MYRGRESTEVLCAIVAIPWNSEIPRVLWQEMSTRGPRGGRTRTSWTRRKRSKVLDDDEEESVRLFFESALVLRPALTTFDLDLPSARAQLADNLWQPSDVLGEGSLTAANAELASVLAVLLRNTYRSANAEMYARRTSYRVESILVNLQRAQSQKQMPLLTARFSLACLRGQLPGKLWELLSLCFPGLLASHAWTEQFVEFARERRPPCVYEELERVGGVMFDNYTRKVMYASKATVSSHGYLLNMTNWGSITIPRVVAPVMFNPFELCKCALEHAPWLASLS